MKNSNENTPNQYFNIFRWLNLQWIKERNTFFLLIITFALTIGNIMTHYNEPPVHWESTEQYGIRFYHPRGFSFSDNTPADWSLSYWQGGIQGVQTQGDEEIIGLFWYTNASNSLENAIDWLLSDAKKENPGISSHNIEQMYIGEKEIMYCNLDLYSGELNRLGVLSAFRDSFGRIIFTYHLLHAGSYSYSKKVTEKIVNSIVTRPPIVANNVVSYWPTYGWKYASSEDFGMDSSFMQDIMIDIKSSPANIKVDCVLVVKNGFIVFEKYFNNYTQDKPHIVYSCTKSILSTIFGIAYEKKFIPTLDTRLIEIFPGKSIEHLDELKGTITLRNLLMMSAGFDARDSWLYNWENLDELHEAPDAVSYMLNLPMSFEPGTEFEYTNGVSHLLSCIITEKTGESAASFGEKYLFDPLGITLHQWDSDNKGRNWGYNRIYLTPQDMAKIGFLFLHEGEWDGEQIISSEWVAEATEHKIDANLASGYGYQWWVEENYYFALGYMGQFIFVFPDKDLIIVFTGSTPETFDFTLDLIQRYIIQ
jgi:CubicO group peptidase (beta-lactamase class C family)